MGWYADHGILYVDDRLENSVNNNRVKALIVHELVHFLQDVSGKFDTNSCDDSIRREREAYGVQTQYLLTTSASAYTRPMPPILCSYRKN